MGNEDVGFGARSGPGVAASVRAPCAVQFTLTVGRLSCAPLGPRMVFQRLVFEVECLGLKVQGLQVYI